jgi:hypothetical protein
MSFLKDLIAIFDVATPSRGGTITQDGQGSHQTTAKVAIKSRGDLTHQYPIAVQNQ